MDYKYIATLLHIVKEAHGHGTQLKGIRDMAMAELIKINGEIEAERQKPPRTVPTELQPVTEPVPGLEEASQNGARRV